MNPWSRAEPESEAIDRELFARRARALEPAVIPSLASVLRAAEASRETRAARSAQGRAFVAMALAAACMAAAVTKLPRAGTSGSITAEIDASAPGAASNLETASAATCELDDEVLVSEERACFAPAPLFTAAPRIATALSPPVPLACSSSESCALSSRALEP